MDNLRQNSNMDSKKSVEFLRNVSAKVLDLAKKKGASQAEVSTSQDIGYSVDVRLGEAEKVEFSHDSGLGLTVFIGQQKGSASTSDMSDKSLSDAVDAAIEIAKVSAEDKCFGLADRAVMASDYPDLELDYAWEMTPGEAIEQACDCERYALAQDARLVNSEGVGVSSYRFCRTYANSHGFNGQVLSSRHGYSCVLVGKEGQGLQRDYDYTSARNPIDLMPMSDVADKAVQNTLSRLNPQKVKSQQVPVLFSAKVASGLLGGLISGITGHNLYRKNSFLLDSLGETLFPDFVNIHEQPHLLAALGSAPFDGDGLLTRNNVFVKNGQLVSYVLDTYGARRLNRESTANSGGVHNLSIEPTGQDYNDLLGLLDRGVVVTELMGQGLNMTTGDYSKGAAGFWVENGQIQYPIDEFTIAGNLKSMFKGFVAVGRDIDARKASRCGSILIDNMMVAGQ